MTSISSSTLSSTTIDTPDAARIAKRLVNHWKHKFEIQEDASSLHILMPDAKISLSPTADALKVVIETTREDYKGLAQVVVDHLDRMALQQFVVQWQHQNQ